MFNVLYLAFAYSYAVSSYCLYAVDVSTEEPVPDKPQGVGEDCRFPAGTAAMLEPLDIYLPRLWIDLPT